MVQMLILPIVFVSMFLAPLWFRLLLFGLSLVTLCTLSFCVKECGFLGSLLVFISGLATLLNIFLVIVPAQPGW